MTYLLIFGDNVFKQLSINLSIISALLHMNAVDLAGFDFSGSVVRVHLKI